MSDAPCNWDVGFKHIQSSAQCYFSFDTFSSFVFSPSKKSVLFFKKSLGSAPKLRVSRVTRNRQFFVGPNMGTSYFRLPLQTMGGVEEKGFPTYLLFLFYFIIFIFFGQETLTNLPTLFLFCQSIYRQQNITGDEVS